MTLRGRERAIAIRSGVMTARLGGTADVFQSDDRPLAGAKQYLCVLGRVRET